MAKREIEIFSAGCPVCQDAIQDIEAAACPSCEVTIVDMQDMAGVKRARELGVKSLPAVAINGQLATCCAGRGPDIATLRALGLGQG